MEKATSREITRRDFTKVSAIAGFGILTHPSFGAKKKINTDTLKVGLLGCGNRGTGAAVNMLEGNDNVVITAMADLFQDRLDGARKQIKDNANPAVAKKYAVDDDHCFTGWDSYLKIMDTDIDIIIEGTLPYSRPKHIDRATLCRKHIFTEKPVAVDPEGIRLVMAAGQRAKDLGLSFVAGTQRRHDRDYVETIKRIQDGKIGDVLEMRCYWCSGIPWVHERQPGWSDLEFQIRNWLQFCWVCGDSITEQHVHNLDVCNWVLNSHPVRVFASGGRTWKSNDEKFGDIYDHFNCDYEYEVDGRVIHLTSMCRHWNGCTDRVSEAVVASKGSSDCRDHCLSKATKKEDKRPAALSPYVQEHIDLISSIRGSGPYLNEAQNVAESTMTSIMGRMAAYTGQAQVWDKALNSDLKLVPEDLDFSKPYPLGPVPAPGAMQKKA